jgi:hypothetical protein
MTSSTVACQVAEPRLVFPFSFGYKLHIGYRFWRISELTRPDHSIMFNMAGCGVLEEMCFFFWNMTLFPVRMLVVMDMSICMGVADNIASRQHNQNMPVAFDRLGGPDSSKLSIMIYSCFYFPLPASYMTINNRLKGKGLIAIYSTSPLVVKVL